MELSGFVNAQADKKNHKIAIYGGGHALWVDVAHNGGPSFNWNLIYYNQIVLNPAKKHAHHCDYLSQYLCAHHH